MSDHAHTCPICDGYFLCDGCDDDGPDERPCYECLRSEVARLTRERDEADERSKLCAAITEAFHDVKVSTETDVDSLLQKLQGEPTTKQLLATAERERDAMARVVEAARAYIDALCGDGTQTEEAASANLHAAQAALDSPQPDQPDPAESASGESLNPAECRSEAKAEPSPEACGGLSGTHYDGRGTEHDQRCGTCAYYAEKLEMPGGYYPCRCGMHGAELDLPARGGANWCCQDWTPRTKGGSNA